jgi:SAM-dependent methyltransferase
LDVGCGTGTWLNAARGLGVGEIQGVEGVEIEADKLHISNENFLVHNLTHPLNLNRKYDLVVCLEVAEHLPESAAQNLIEILTSHSDTILFSAAVPYQGGQNHINEQWPEYWQGYFENKGFYPYDILRSVFWGNNKIEWWYKQNMVIYSRKQNMRLAFAEPVESFKAYIHPEVLIAKTKEIESLSGNIERLSEIIEKNIEKPRVGRAFKILLRALKLRS